MSKIALYRKSSLTCLTCYTMKRSLFIILIFFSGFASSQHREIFLYKDPVPGSENWNWTERKVFVKVPLNANVLYNISRPSLLVFTPVTANGTAVIVCPGGAYHVLNIENDGIKVANELVKKGITVFVFKHRLVRSVTDDPWLEMQDSRKDSVSFFTKVDVVRKMARQDLNKAISFVRQQAVEFNIDTNRVGLMGFSSGGVLAANVAYNFIPEAKPDFVAPIYSVITTIERPGVRPDAPPLFIAAATDDQFAPVSNSIALYNDWMNAKRPVELHIYSKGGHGLYGLPAANWIIRFEEWLDGLGYLKPRQ